MVEQIAHESFVQIVAGVNFSSNSATSRNRFRAESFASKMLDSDPNQDGARKRAGRSELLLILTVAAAFIVAALVSYLVLDWRAR
jgi:hypothetical protein